MRLVRCLRCKGTMNLYKEDPLRFWYKCDNEDCDFVCTDPKPLFNKAVEETPIKKNKRLDKNK